MSVCLLVNLFNFKCVFERPVVNWRRTQVEVILFQTEEAPIQNVISFYQNCAKKRVVENYLSFLSETRGLQT